MVSVIEMTCTPLDCSDRIAISRPDPGPLTKQSTWRRPCSIALRAAASAVTWAAYGVLSDDVFTLKRESYDIAAVQTRMRQAGLPGPLIERLSTGQ